MSFSFGSPATTTGSTFGTAAASTDNKPAFNFTSPTNSTSAPAFGGFSFGAKTTTAASSLFGSPSAATTTTSAFGASKPLSFGGFQSPPNQTVGSPGFGQPAQSQQNAPQNLSFGGATQSAPAFGSPATQAQPPAFGSPTASTGLFGQPAATTASFSFNTPASGFSAQPAAQPNVATPAAPFGARPAAPTPAFGQGSAFGKPASGGFSFGATTSAPSFGTPAASTFGQPAATAQPQPTQPQPTQQQPQQQTTGLTFGQTPQLGTPTPAFGASTGLNFATTQQQPQQQSNQQQQSATPGFSFGQTTQSAPTTQTVTQSSFSFSQTPATAATESSFTSLFDRKPTTTQTPQTQPKLGFAPTTSAGLNFGTTTTASTGINFGLPTSTSQAQPLSFPTTSALPTTTTPTSLTFSTPSSTATSFSLPATSTVTSNFATVTSSFGTTTSAGINFGTSAATGLTFAKPAATTAVSSAAATSAPTGISLLPKSTAAPISTMPSLTTVTTTAAAAPPQAFASISFAQLEENINKWTLELEEQEKTFINQATQINAWDRLLIANGEKIVELNDAVETVKNEQQSLEHELDFVLAQQKELEDLLAPMEKQLLEESGDRIRDPEREHMYSLAENLDTQLRQMSEDLKEVIEHLNETNRSQDSNDPIVQIGRILNAHMSSMQWIDNSIAQISTKLDQLKATHDTLRRDNERSFQLTYN